MRARIGIVDDHPAVLLGLAAIFDAEPDLHVDGTAGSVDGLLALSRALDVVLLDLALADGTTPAENLRSLRPLGVPVLVYSVGERPALVREAARAGAFGMVRKSEPPAVIVEAVRSVLRGDVAASADWAAALDVDSQFVALTPREVEVLSHYAAGETAERVAALLYISRETVLDHIRRIRLKYAQAGRASPTKVDLYRRALEDGHIPASDEP